MIRFTLVACRNADKLHAEQGIDYFLYKTMSGTEIVLHPTYDLIRSTVPEGEKVRIIWRPCAICKSRGIKGFSHLKGDEELPPDPYEKTGEPT